MYTLSLSYFGTNILAALTIDVSIVYRAKTLFAVYPNYCDQSL